MGKIKQFLDENLNPVEAFRPNSVINVNAGSTSDAFTENCIIRVILSATGYIEIAPAPNDSKKVYVAADSAELFRVNIGDKLKATTGNANITILE